ncbi:hypothetical protein PIB30_079028, partial [Stylosanthes scabra]|nr:hypothetical protein [Stylosanthes scabra]
MRDSDITKPPSSTHRRRRPTHICVEGILDQQATMHDPCRSRSCVAPNFTRPTHRRGSPRICVGSQDHHASTRNL